MAVLAPKPHLLRVNVAARQEFDYDWRTDDSEDVARLVCTAQSVRGGNVLWRVQRFDPDDDGKLQKSPSYDVLSEMDDRNRRTNAPEKVKADKTSFGASEEARKGIHLVMSYLNLNYPKGKRSVGEGWRDHRPHPFKKGREYFVDYKLLKDDVREKAWNCYEIEFSSSVSIGNAGKEIHAEGKSKVERSTGMPVDLELTVTGMDAVSESLPDDIEVRLTRGGDE